MWKALEVVSWILTALTTFFMLIGISEFSVNETFGAIFVISAYILAALWCRKLATKK